MQTAALIWNPAAGKGDDDLPELRAALSERFALTVLKTDRGCDADVCAARAVANGAQLVIAAGGDGTVSLVAGALVGSTAQLGIVARGTSNSIATGLGVPTDLAGAIHNLIEGRPHLVDTARANGRTMVLHASLGFHAATVGGTAREAKNRWGVLAYLKEGLQQLREMQPFDVELETDSEIVRCQATNITVANVAPLKTLLAQGPASMAPDDGQLDVTIVAATGLAEAVATGLHLLRTAAQGEPATRDNVGFLSTRFLRVNTTPPQPLLVDGEPVGEGSLTVTCVPRSLRVVLPERPEPHRPDGDDKLEGLPGLEIETKT